MMLTNRQSGNLRSSTVPFFTTRVIVTALAWWCLAAVPAQAQRLIDEDPYDTIVLNGQNLNRELQVVPVEWPRGKDPANLRSSDRVRIRLLSNPDEQLELSWGGVERMILFEERLLREAKRLTTQQKFDESFEYLAFIRVNYPDIAGLDAAIDKLLYAEALGFYRTAEYERSLLLLGELYQRRPALGPVIKGLQRVLEAQFKQLIDSGQLNRARRLFELAKDRYAKAVPQILEKWETTLQRLAAQALETAEAKMADGDYRAAYLGAREVLEIWPDTSRVQEFSKLAAQRYPLVRVGVTDGPEAVDRRQRWDAYGWVTRRRSRLIDRQLFELIGVGPDGAEYRCVPGAERVADNYRSLEIQVDSGNELTGIQVAQLMLLWADGSSPWSDPIWMGLVGRVGTEGLMKTVAGLQRPFLRPQAALDIPCSLLPTEGLRKNWRVYDLASNSDDQSQFTINPEYVLATATQPRELIEQRFDTPQQGLRALRNGQIDLIDRVFPADVDQIRRDKRFQVRRYRIPGLHALVPNFNRPFTGNRIFRRALLYAIDREKILGRDLLAGRSLEGCRVISGPFSPGLRSDDPMAYGNDGSLEPRAYDPRHARTLLQLAQVEMASTGNQQDASAPELRELVLVCPASDIARVACDEIVEDLALIGIACRLRQLKPGENRPVDDEWDLLYVEYNVADPLVAAKRLLAHDGFMACPSPHVNLALRQLERVIAWSEAGEKLRTIHQLTYEDCSLLPLWQLVDHMVARNGISGLPNEPITTYQSIESWRVLPE